MNVQIDLFNTNWETLPKEIPGKDITYFSNENSNSLDIRTELQSNRKYAYDVGEKVRGSRKEEALVLKKFWDSEKSITLLKKMEKIDPALTASLVTRDEIFSDFSLEAEKDAGTAPEVARLKQLLIQRIDKYPKDSGVARNNFFVASTWYKKQLNNIRLFSEFKEHVYKVRNVINAEKIDPDYLTKKVNSTMEEVEFLSGGNRYERNKEDIIFLKKSLEKEQKMLSDIHEAKELSLSSLGDKFKSFFSNDAKSANSSINNVRKKVSSWDDLLTKSSLEKKRKVFKPVWERTLPDNPSRVGGISSDIYTSEQLLKTFGFRGVQFGNYTKDEHGSEHIFKSSESFFDLVDILQLSSYQSIALDNHLAMAYGARGRGKGNAHYERGHKVINMTRDNGHGSLAHEWFHALDHYLYCYSFNFNNGLQENMSSDIEVGTNLPIKISSEWKKLISLLQDGHSIRYEKYNGEQFRRIPKLLFDLYEEHEGNLLDCMLTLKEIEISHIAKQEKMARGFSRSFNRDTFEKKSVTKLRKYAKALAYLHQDETGDTVDEIPVPMYHTSYLESSIQLDRGSKGNYWSSPTELAARAFEAYTEDKLHASNRRNDYLVCGTKDPIAFPIGHERTMINMQFDALITAIMEENLL